MIESERGRAGGGMPSGVIRIISRFRHLIAFDHCGENYADGMASRVASGVAECAYLIH